MDREDIEVVKKLLRAHRDSDVCRQALVAIQQLELDRDRAERNTPRWSRCPSTHCERRQECASPSECASSSKTWGDVYWQWVRHGCDRSDAAYRADQWEERQNRHQRAGK